MKTIKDFKIGDVYLNDKDHKIEVTDIKKDDSDGVIEMKLYVHKDSVNCKNYGWKHNTKYFLQWFRLGNNIKTSDTLNYLLNKESYREVTKV